MWYVVLCFLLSCCAQLCLCRYDYQSPSSPSDSFSSTYSSYDHDLSNFDNGPFLPPIPGIGMGLVSNELRDVLSSFSIDKIPAVAEHIYGSPIKLIISNYQGPMKSLYGTVESFYHVEMIDQGGHNFGYSPSSSYSEKLAPMDYNDFMFPPG